jgi:hypothetical protein
MADKYIPVLSQKEEKAKTLVMDRYRTYLNYRKTNYDKKWIDYTRQYRSKIENEAEYPYMARLFIPYSFTSVETTIPRLMGAIFSSDPVIAVKPRIQDDVENAKTMEQLVNYQIEQMNLFNTSISLFKDACILGTFISKVDWKKESRQKKRIALEEVYENYDEMGNPVGQPINQPILNDKGKPITEKYDVNIYDDNYIYRVDPFWFLIDPKADPTDPIDSAEAVIFIKETTIPKLRQMEKDGIYKNISEVEKVKGIVEFTEGNERFNVVDKTAPTRLNDKHTQRVTLYEYWEDDRVIVLAEEKVIIRDEPNPYWHCKKPFLMARICPVQNEIYGIGLMEMVESLQHELNDTRNQRMDNIKFCLNKMWIIARNADVTLPIISEPGGIIISNDVDGVKDVTTGDVTQSSFVNARDIAEDIQRAHGIHDPALGKPTARETATGVLSLQEAANARFQMMIMIACRNFFNKAAEMMIDNNQQFITGEKVFRLTGGKDITIKDINEVVGHYDYEPVGASLEGLTKYARIEQLFRARNALADNEKLNKTKFDMQILELLNIKNVGEYFYTDQEMAQKMAMANMGAGGGMPPTGISQGLGQGVPPTGGGMEDLLTGAGRRPPIIEE